MNAHTHPTSAEESEPQALAERAAEAMYAQDRASQMLGMTIEAMGPGRARLSMPVREDMVNGYAICHGGLIFALADSAFAFACNACNRQTVAAGGNIEFLRPAYAGETLTAEGRECHREGRGGVYDITVTNDKDELVALFRGKCREVGGQIVED